jgi:hypothetical protein
MTNQQMWAIYAQGIAQAAGFSNSPDGFILNGNTTIANFATSSAALPVVPSLTDALFQIYGLGNTEAAQQGIYTPSQFLFFNDYASYIDNLIPKGSQKAPTPTQAAQLTLLQGQLTKANTTLSNDLTSAQAAWTQQSTLFPGKYPSFQSFLNQTAWGSTINTDNSALSGINTQLNSLMTTIYGQDYVAIALAKQTVDSVRSAMQGSVVGSPSEMAVTAASGTLVVPTYNPGSLATFSSWVDTTISQHGNGAQPITIDFNQSAAQFDFSKSSYFSQTNWNADFFFFSASGGSSSSGTQVNIDSSSSSFSLTFQYDAITQLPISRGPWFDSSLMGSYTNPKNLCTPTNLIIGMYPAITMSMDAASYTAAKSAYNSANGFGFGAFWVSGTHSSSSSSLQLSASWDDSSNSVKIASPSIEPVILAMQVTQVA